MIAAPVNCLQLDAPEAGRARLSADYIRLFLAHWRGSLLALGVVTTMVFATIRSFAPLNTLLFWVCTVGLNTIVQAGICYAMERTMAAQSTPGPWLPRLLVSIGINGLLWGLLPFMVADASAAAVVGACLVDGMLLFCIFCSPGTRGMYVIASIFVFVPSWAALLYAGLLREMFMYAAMVGAIAFNGFRLRAEQTRSLVARYKAEQLAAELRANQERVVSLECERTLILERQRLTRDMHDGLGSALVASLAAVERGELPPEEIGPLLRDCVDDLRSVIDSLAPAAEGDLALVLASQRLRLERRLKSGGVALR